MERPHLKEKKKESISFEEIQSWPKVDLHCHLDGSLRLETLIELAKSQGIKLPCSDIEGLKSHLGIGQAFSSLENYISVFDFTLNVLQSREGLSRVAYELAEDASKENVVYLEVRFAPVFHTSYALKWSETVNSVLEGLKKAEKDFDINCRLILTGIRSMDPIISKELAELAVAYKGKGVVGFDLAGAETHNSASDHTEAFYVIKNNNINCTLHAGEVEGRKSIHEALHYCGADRIGQGTRLIENSDLLNYVNDHRIPLEICLSSAVNIGTHKTIDSHPFPFYLDYGLRVTLNSDSRLFTNTTVSQELMLAAKTFSLSKEDLKKIIINGFKAAFLPYREKVTMMDKYLPRLGKKVPKFQALRLIERDCD